MRTEQKESERLACVAYRSGYTVNPIAQCSCWLASFPQYLRISQKVPKLFTIPTNSGPRVKFPSPSRFTHFLCHAESLHKYKNNSLPMMKHSLSDWAITILNKVVGWKKKEGGESWRIIGFISDIILFNAVPVNWTPWLLNFDNCH